MYTLAPRIIHRQTFRTARFHNHIYLNRATYIEQLDHIDEYIGDAIPHAIEDDAQVPLPPLRRQLLLLVARHAQVVRPDEQRQHLSRRAAGRGRRQVVEGWVEGRVLNSS